MLTDNILNLIGNKPLVQPRGERVFAKPESLNPGGSECPGCPASDREDPGQHYDRPARPRQAIFQHGADVIRIAADAHEKRLR